jgi:hypothetical protein
VPVVEESPENPNPKGKEKDAAHNPIGLKTETERQEAASKQKIEKGDRRSHQGGSRHQRSQGNAA